MMDSEALINITSAIYNGRTDIVRTLVSVCEKGEYESEDLSNDLSPEVLLNNQCTQYGAVLHLATKLDHLDIVRTLLAAGADPSIKNEEEKTPLDLVESPQMFNVYVEALLKAAATSDIDCMTKLLSAGVPVNSLDSPESQNTVLHWASRFGDAKAVQYLIDNGAQVDAVNADGATPLHDAVCHKDIAVIRKLLQAGACPLTRTKIGKNGYKTPIDLASSEKEIMELLLTFSANNIPYDKGNDSSESVSSSLLEQSPIANGIVEDVRRLSLTSLDSPQKHPTFSSYSQSTLQPFLQLSAPPPLITDTKLHLLWPLPQRIIQLNGSVFKLQNQYSVCIVQDDSKLPAADILNVWTLHSDFLNTLNVDSHVHEIIPLSAPCATHCSILLHVGKSSFQKQQSYKIVINSSQVRILASDLLGLHYGLCTIAQLFNLYRDDSCIPCMYVEDWPVLHHRAVLLDMAPLARKPTIETLKGFIRTISTLKMNEIHFYFISDPKTGNKWPYSNSELMEISTFCRKYYITAVPVIDVNPSSVYEEFVYSSPPVQQLMSLFFTTNIHIGPNLSKLLLDACLCAEKIENVWNMLKVSSNSFLYICSNGYIGNTDLLQLLPLNVILVEFGYQADYDYDAALRSVIYSGFPACLGIGTSTWGSIAGCPEAATNNIYKAAQAASSHGAHGLIIADWKTIPHHPALCFSWPGITIMAGLAWNSSVHLDFLHTRMPELLNYYIFQDSEQLLGSVTMELGRLEAFIHQTMQSSKVIVNSAIVSSVLHHILIDPDNVSLDLFSRDALQQTVHHLKKFEFDSRKARPKCLQHEEIVAELQMAVELLLFSCRIVKALATNGIKPYSESSGATVVNVGVTNLPPTTKTDLANKLLVLVKTFKEVWSKRNLYCGLPSSLELFSSLLHQLIPDSEHFFSSSDGFLRQ